MTDDGQKQMVTGAHHASRTLDGEVIDQMRPAKWYFRKHEEEPTTEVAIRRSFAEDLYIVMPAFEIEEQTASVEVHINPLVNWVWFGFGILAIGTGIALLPEASTGVRGREAAGRSGDGVDAAAVDPAVARRGVRAARRDRAGSAAAAGRRRKSREVAHKLACWCGGCSKLPVGQCSCGHCAIERAEDRRDAEGRQDASSRSCDYYVDDVRRQPGPERAAQSAARAASCGRCRSSSASAAS